MTHPVLREASVPAAPEGLFRLAPGTHAALGQMQSRRTSPRGRRCACCRAVLAEGHRLGEKHLDVRMGANLVSCSAYRGQRVPFFCLALSRSSMSAAIASRLKVGLQPHSSRAAPSSIVWGHESAIA